MNEKEIFDWLHAEHKASDTLRLNEREDENGWEWDTLEYHFVGDDIDGWTLDVDGWCLVHHTQGRAPDGGTYAETTAKIEEFGYQTEEELAKLAHYAVEG